jgi:Abnormal spindle-like microcephaly-assoc'd, ASPM-SPD-2-Hydin/HYDIN/CFA65/VesB-like, Ig-like domain/Cep192 domain 4
VKALRSRCVSIAVLLAFSTLVGCQGLQGSPSPDSVGQTLVVNQSVVDFGTVVTGSNQVLWESIYNPLRQRVKVTEVDVTGAGFRLSNTRVPFTIFPHQRVWFQIVFAPQASGAASGTITISSSAPQSSTTISLTGDVVPAGQLSPSPSTISFGSVRVGSSAQKSGMLTNTGDTSVTVSQIAVSGTAFKVTGAQLPVTLAPNQRVSFTAVFEPQAGGSSSASIVVSTSVSMVAAQRRQRRFRAAAQSADQTSTVTIPVSGTGAAGGQLVAPAAVSFGSPQVGSSQTKQVTVTNSGASTVTISQAAVSGTGFSASGLSAPMTLATGQSTTVNCTFTPKSAGAANGSLTITSDASNPTVSVSLTGTGATAGSLTASPVSFGSVTVGGSQKETVAITNSGGSSVDISQAAASGTGFSVSGLSLPLTLAAGQSASATVTFAPQTAGNASGSLTITSDAATPTLVVPLSASAVTPGTLSATPASLSFGAVADGSTQSLPATLTNSGGTSVTVTQATFSGAGFSLSGLSLPATLAAGKSASFNVVFSPQSAGSASANLTLTSNGSNPSLMVAISGTGTAAGDLTASPSSIPFGSVQVGDDGTQQATLTNSGGTSVTVSQVNVSGTGFTLSGVSLPLTLSAGQSFTFSVKFSPQAAGSASGSIAVVSSASGTTPGISLSGTGAAAGQASVTPSSLSFGSVAVGDSKTLTATVGASGSSVTLTSASVSTPEYALSGLSLPLTIAAGQSATFSVIFTPQSSGSASATISFVTAGSSTPLVASLAGSGTAAAAQHSVDLSWNASSSSSVTGYNIYRGSASAGPFSKVNSTLDDNTAYTDNSVQAGQTYYYVTTAVTGDGAESGYSNVVQAVVPSP